MFCFWSERIWSHDFIQEVVQIELHLFKNDLAWFHLVIIEDIIDKRKEMVPRKTQCLDIIHLIIPGIALEQQVGDANNLIKRCPDLMAHSRHEYLLWLRSLLRFLAGNDEVIKHHPALYGDGNLVGNEINNIKVVLWKFIFVVIILQAHYPDNVVLNFKRNTHPDLTVSSDKTDIAWFFQHPQIILP